MDKPNPKTEHKRHKSDNTKHHRHSRSRDSKGSRTSRRTLKSLSPSVSNASHYRKKPHTPRTSTTSTKKLGTIQSPSTSPRTSSPSPISPSPGPSPGLSPGLSSGPSPGPSRGPSTTPPVSGAGTSGVRRRLSGQESNASPSPMDGRKKKRKKTRSTTAVDVITEPKPEQSLDDHGLFKARTSSTPRPASSHGLHKKETGLTPDAPGIKQSEFSAIKKRLAVSQTRRATLDLAACSDVTAFRQKHMQETLDRANAPGSDEHVRPPSVRNRHHLSSPEHIMPPATNRQRRRSVAILSHMPSARPLAALNVPSSRNRSASITPEQANTIPLIQPPKLPRSQTSSPPLVKPWQQVREQVMDKNIDTKKQRTMFMDNPKDPGSLMKLTTKEWQSAVKERQLNISTLQPKSNTPAAAEEGMSRMRRSSTIGTALESSPSTHSQHRTSLSGLVQHVFRPSVAPDDALMSTAEAGAMIKGTPATGEMHLGSYAQRVGQYMNACRRGTIYIPLTTLESSDASSLSGSEADELDNLENKLDELDENQIEELRHKFKVMPTKMKHKKEYRRRLLAYEDMHGLGIMNDKNVYKMIKEELQRKWNNMSFTIWKKSFVLIESHFGTSTVAYFYFLRWLVYLNFSIALLQFLFILLPQIVWASNPTFTDYVITHNLENNSFARKAMRCSEYYYSRNTSGHLRGNSTLEKSGFINFMHLVQGTGFMERSPLFYGDYFNRSRISIDGVEESNYNMSLAYLLTTIAYFVISFICIMKSSGSGMTEMLSRDSETVHTTFTNKAFGSWDYCITDPEHARLTHKNIATDFMGYANVHSQR